MTEDDYLIQLQQLLPTGPAWPREPDSVLSALLHGLAAEFARLDGRADWLLEEADPRTATELLEDWERVVGIPDECAGQGDTVAARRAAAHQKLAELGGQNAAYFLGIAKVLGFTGVILEYRPFVAGDHAGDLLYGDAWVFHWTLEITQETGDVDRAVLECVIGRAKPAHTTVNFTYPNV